MLRQILFTILVIIAVITFYKIKNRVSDGIANHNSAVDAEQPEGKLTTKVMAYIVLIFLALFSSIFFVLNWVESNQVIAVRVINGQNQITHYEVHSKQLKQRSFITTQGLEVTLSESDRIEIQR